MKKYLITVFCIVVLAVCLALPAYAMGSIDADSVVMSVDEMTCVNYALDYAEAYYNEIYGTSDTDGRFIFDLTVKDDLILQYLVELCQYKCLPKFNHGYDDYSGRFEVYEVLTIGEVVYCDISCKLNYRYPYKKTISGTSGYLFFKFEKNDLNEWVLSDYYDAFDPINYIRGEVCDLQGYISSVESISEELLVKLIDSRCSYESNMKDTRRIEALLENQEVILQSSESETDEVYDIQSTASLHSFDRGSMFNYAWGNYDGTPPASGNSSYAPYINMYASGGDCTNYISHCLLSGGAVPDESSNGWYCNSNTDRTSTWSYVAPFYNYITRTKSFGPYGILRSLNLSSTPIYDVCDIIQIDYNYEANEDNEWHHSTLIVGFAPYYYGGDPDNGIQYQWDPQLSYRSNTRLGEFDVSFVETYMNEDTYEKARVIELYGYYS